LTIGFLSAINGQRKSQWSAVNGQWSEKIINGQRSIVNGQKRSSMVGGQSSMVKKKRQKTSNTMFRNYFKIAFRTLWKNRLFTAINVIGLSLGLGSAGVLILFIQRGITFDTFHQDNDQIYYLQTEAKDGRYNKTVYPIRDQLLKTYPEIEAGTHVQGWNNAWMNYKGKDLQKDTKYVENSFFDIFSFKLKYGDRKTVLKRKESIVLSEQVSEALFGKRNPVGETITVNDTSAVTVTGVLETIPANSSIQFDVLMPIANLEANPGFMANADWFNTFASVYVKVRKGADMQKLEKQFPAFAKTHFAAEVKDRKIHLTPFKDFIHYENPGFKGMIYGAGTIVVFILLIISINLLNLNTAVSFTRAKEVAVRKVTGSTLRQLLIQFWTESGIVLVASLALSVVLAIWYLVPQFNEFRKGRMQLVFDWAQDYPTILTLVTIILVIAFIAGTYPAMYLNRLDLRDTINGKLSNKPKSNGWTRSGLIVVQFVVSFVLMIGAISVHKQIAFMRYSNPGFEKENVVVVQSDLQYKDEEGAVSQFKGILDDLQQNSNVKSIATSGVVPTKYWINYNIYQPDGQSDQEVRFRHVGTGPRYAETFGIKLVEGRDFSDELDKDGENKPVIINEAAMKALGWKSAVGKRLRQKNNPDVYTVVGVMKDFHYQEMREKIEPLLHWYEGKTSLNSYLSIKFNDMEQAKTILADLETKTKTIPAKKPFSYFYLSEEVSRQYNHLDGLLKMADFVTVLSIIIAFAGIFGLISLAANQRTKEVGIRKVLGASVYGITVLLSREFVVLVLISIVIGTPIAYTLVSKYLNDFQYHITISWYIYAIVGVSALILTALTVGIQSIKAALMDPVRSLRNE
jgi:putative ABC transport system permease protein